MTRLKATRRTAAPTRSQRSAARRNTCPRARRGTRWTNTPLGSTHRWGLRSSPGDARRRHPLSPFSPLLALNPLPFEPPPAGGAAARGAHYRRRNTWPPQQQHQQLLSPLFCPLGATQSTSMTSTRSPSPQPVQPGRQDHPNATRMRRGAGQARRPPRPPPSSRLTLFCCRPLPLPSPDSFGIRHIAANQRGRSLLRALLSGRP